jgi:hypothetical protein
MTLRVVVTCRSGSANNVRIFCNEEWQAKTVWPTREAICSAICAIGTGPAGRDHSADRIGEMDTRGGGRLSRAQIRPATHVAVVHRASHGRRSQLPGCSRPRREPGSGSQSGAVQLEHGLLLQGTQAFAAEAGAAPEPNCCRALERAPGPGVEMARPRGQAHRRHDGLDARYGRQPQGLPAQ